MPIAFYCVPYRRNNTNPMISDFPEREIALQGQAVDIAGGGGTWDGLECFGGQSICKVRARSAVLTTLDGLYFRFPKDSLLDSLSDIGAVELTRLVTKLLSLGWLQTEIDAEFVGGLGNYTLGNLLGFMISRRRIARFALGSFIWDGEEITVPRAILGELDRRII